MKSCLSFFLLLCLTFYSNLFYAQKKPLDHSVYDGWQHIGEKLVSNDGRWIVYTVEPQQGDAELVIRSGDGSYTRKLARGYLAQITDDSRYLICRIKAPYAEIREARIRKKKTEDFPKDSLAIIELGKENTWKVAAVKNFKIPQEAGGWIVYTVEPQQGDAELVIRSGDGSYTRKLARGYLAQITDDSRYLIYRIKAPYAEIREARIRKKKTEDFPKDSLGIIELGKENTWKVAAVKNFKIPQETGGWVAYHREKSPASPKAKETTDKKTDSLYRVIDSLKQLLMAEKPEKKKRKKDGDDTGDPEVEIVDGLYAEGDEGNSENGTPLVLRSLSSGEETVFNNVLEYYFNKKGNKLLIRQAKDPGDPSSKMSVSVFDLAKKEFRTIISGGNDFKNLAISEDGSRVAFVAERDSKPKDLLKYYKLWYFQEGWDTAIAVADRYTVGMPLGNTVSEYGAVSFSKTGNRLFFGTAPNPIPKDTTIEEIDMPKLDLWHYNDDYLQTVQNYPARLRAAQQQSYLAMMNTQDRSIRSLGCREVPQVLMTNEGDGDVFVGISDLGKRIESQWEGATRKDIYAIYVNNGEHRLVQKDVTGNIYPSPGGKVILWYDRKKKNYYAWDGKAISNISADVKQPLWNEENDSPSDPGNYGVMGWQEGDSAVYVYDMYDAWKLDIAGNKSPQNITKGLGRKDQVETRYISLDPEKRSFRHGDHLLFATYNRVNKKKGFRYFSTDGYRYSTDPGEKTYAYADVKAARDNPGHIIYTKENFNEPPDIYYAVLNRDEAETHHDLSGRVPLAFTETKLSSINPQQSQYTWGTAELFKWKAYNGKDATGVLYKPENFDPKKKYPLIVYFYEKLSQDLYDYKEPAPIRSAINIPFFVSRGYVIFLPDIVYEIGHPGKSAYDYIVSGARAIARKGWADSTRMAIQGHSWGGYQAAQLATMTKLFKAVWAGAPVANMTSAYGGIRWESGVSRQFQYEKTQSRIGGTLWDKLPLYLENSPLFHLDKVTAPMVIMHNDADGAVPWYQGIELFTALRRLGKKVWMFNYNGQGHGLTQRQDMRDYQIRMQQFFDWILKDEYPARWITDGIPAVDKGKDLGY